MPDSSKNRLRSLGARLGTIFFKGLIAVLPLSATLVVFFWIAGTFEGILRHPLELVLKDYYKPGMGLATGFVLIFLVGLLVNLWFTQQLLAWGENLLQGLPLAKTILSGVKDLMGFFHRDKTQAPNQVVVVELNGLRMLGLVTRQTLEDLPPQISSGDRIAVFFPMSYQMGGFTTFVPRAAVTPVDMPMENAMRFILTAGVKPGTKTEVPGEPNKTASTPAAPLTTNTDAMVAPVQSTPGNP